MSEQNPARPGFGNRDPGPASRSAGVATPLPTPLTPSPTPLSPGSLTPAVPVVPPIVPDHELLHCIGRGSYGDVWLARNVLGEFRAVKAIYRAHFDADRPYEREFEGLKRYEPVSRTHPSQVAILHVGRNDPAGFY